MFPTATIFPPLTTTEPFSIGGADTGTIRALRMTNVACAPGSGLYEPSCATTGRGMPTSHHGRHHETCDSA